MMIYYLRTEKPVRVASTKNSNIGNFSRIAHLGAWFFSRRIFVDWEKASKRAHNFHPITGNVRDLMNHNSDESRANDKKYNITQYGHRRHETQNASFAHVFALHHDHKYTQ